MNEIEFTQYCKNVKKIRECINANANTYANHNAEPTLNSIVLVKTVKEFKIGRLLNLVEFAYQNNGAVSVLASPLYGMSDNLKLLLSMADVTLNNITDSEFERTSLMQAQKQEQPVSAGNSNILERVLSVNLIDESLNLSDLINLIQHSSEPKADDTNKDELSTAQLEELLMANFKGVFAADVESSKGEPKQEQAPTKPALNWDKPLYNSYGEVKQHRVDGGASTMHPDIRTVSFKVDGHKVRYPVYMKCGTPAIDGLNNTLYAIVN